MSTNFIYIVTHYGCNGTPSDLWTPTTKLFTDYKDAYAEFLKISPYLLNDKENKAQQYVNNKYNHEDNNNKEYIVIESVKQIAGYHSGDSNCAKRPQGILIARFGLNFS